LLLLFRCCNIEEENYKKRERERKKLNYLLPTMKLEKL
jgi:hypothetical protein